MSNLFKFAMLVTTAAMIGRAVAGVPEVIPNIATDVQFAGNVSPASPLLKVGYPAQTTDSDTFVDHTRGGDGVARDRHGARDR